MMRESTLSAGTKDELCESEDVDEERSGQKLQLPSSTPCLSCKKMRLPSGRLKNEGWKRVAAESRCCTGHLLDAPQITISPLHRDEASSKED